MRAAADQPVNGLCGILFDLDGTLIDTAAAEKSVWPSLAAIIEKHFPNVDRVALQTRYLDTFGPHWTAYLEGRSNFAEYRRARLSEALEPWGELTDELFDTYYTEKRRTIELLRPFNGTLNTLQQVRSAGLRWGLLTNGPSWMQRRKLEVTGLASEFDAIAISEEIGSSKPAPEAFYAAAEMIGCEPERAAMVGDSRAYDIEGALAAGLALAVHVNPSSETTTSDVPVVREIGELPALLGIRAAS